MAGINSISASAVSSAGVNEGSKTTATPKSDNVAVGLAEQAATGSSDTVQLSTRAQKIQKLQEDFFPAGYKSIKVTPEFIARLQEYGFISSADATRLSPTAASIGSSAAGAATGATEKLAVALDSIIERLRDKDPDNSLIGILEKADAALAELDGPLSNTAKTDIKEVFKALGEYEKTDPDLPLTDSENNTLQQLKLVMSLAEKLSQESNPSEKINSYLAILQQSF